MPRDLFTFADMTPWRAIFLAARQPNPWRFPALRDQLGAAVLHLPWG